MLIWHTDTNTPSTKKALRSLNTVQTIEGHKWAIWLLLHAHSLSLTHLRQTLHTHINADTHSFFEARLILERTINTVIHVWSGRLWMCANLWTYTGKTLNGLGSSVMPMLMSLPQGLHSCLGCSRITDKWIIRTPPLHTRLHETTRAS